MASIGDLAVTISANIGDFLSAIGEAMGSIGDLSRAASDSSGGFDSMGNAAGRASSQITDSGREAKEAFDSLRETINTVIETLGVMEAIHIGKEIISGSLEAGESLHQLSLQTGISSDNLQNLQFAAAATGTNVDRLAIGVQRLGQTIESGSAKGEALAKAFGISESDLNNSYGMLEKVSAEINKLGVGSTAAAQLMGAAFGPRNIQLEEPLARMTEFGDKLDALNLRLQGPTVEALTRAQESVNIFGFALHQAEEIFTALLAPAIQAIETLLTDLVSHFVTAATGPDQLREKSKEMSLAVIEGLDYAVQAAMRFSAGFLDMAGNVISAVGNMGSEITKLGGWLNAAATEVTSLGAAVKEFAINPIQAVRDINAAFNTFSATMTKTVADANAGRTSNNALADSFHALASKIRTEMPAAAAEMDRVAAEIVVNNKKEEKSNKETGDSHFDLSGKAKKAADERLAAVVEAAKGEVRIQQAQLANDKTFYEEEFALGQTTREQETAQLLSAENRNYQIEHNALERDLAELKASGDAKPAQIQKVNDQIELLEVTHAGRVQSIHVKADEAAFADLQKTNATVISEKQQAGDAQVALEQAQTQRQLDLGQITKQQAIQQNIDEENQKYTIQQNAFEQEFAALQSNLGTTNSQYEAFYAKVEKAQQAHDLAIYNENTKSQQENLANLNTFLSSVEGAYSTVFDTIFDDIGKGWKKLGQDLLGDVKKIGEEILKSGIRDILFGTQGQTGPLAGLVNMLGVGPQGLLGKLFGPLFGVSGAAATGVVGSGTNAVAPAMNIVATKVADMGDAVGNSVTGAGTAAAGAITHAGSVAGNAFTAAGTTVSKGLSDSVGAVAKSAVGPAAGACCNTLDGAASSIKDGSTKIGKAAEPLSSAGDSLGHSATTLNKTVDDFSDPIHTLKTGSAALEHSAQDVTGAMPTFKSGSAAMGDAADSLSKFSEIIPPLRDATGNLRDTASKLASTASDLGTLGGGGLPAPTVSTVGGIPVSVGTTGAGFGPIGMPFMPAVPGMIPPGPKASVEPGALPGSTPGAVAAPITNIISTLIGPVTTLLTNAFNSTSAVVSHLINTAFVTNAPVVTTIWNQAFLGSLPAVIPLFNSGFNNSVPAIIPLFRSGFGNSVPAIIPLFGSGFNANQPNVNKLFKNAFDSSQPNINKALQNAIDSSQPALQRAFQSLLPVFAQAAELFGVISCALLTACCSCGGGGGGGQPGMMGGGGGGGGGGQPSIFPSVGGAIGLAGLLRGLGGGGGIGSLGAFDAAGQGQFPIPLGSASQYTGAQGTGLLGSEGGGLGSQFGSLATGGLGIAAALGPLIGGALGGQTGSTIGGGIGGATLLGLGALTGNPLLAIGGGIELLTSLLGIGGGRPTAEATQDIGQFASSSVPSLRQLGKGAQALAAAGIPVSSPQAGPIFGPYFNAARILEDVIRWGPGGLTDTHAQDLDALTLKNAMTEMGNPGHGTATINAIAQAWNNYLARGGSNAQLTQLTGISGFERGGISPMGGLAMLHPNEMVLPSNIAEAIKKMAIAPPAAPVAHTDNRTPRAYHVHFNINAIDSRSVESWINENQHLIADAVFNSSRQFRNLGIES